MLLPSSLTPVSQSALANLEQYQLSQNWSENVYQQLEFVAGLSQFVVEVLAKDEILRVELPAMLEQQERYKQYRDALAQQLLGCADEMSGQRVLRQFRNREMAYIAWRDFCGSWSLEQSLKHVSELAEAMIFETYQWQYKACCELWGTPCNEQGEAQPMLIIGMGKRRWGVGLIFRSDIDLIFTYPEMVNPRRAPQYCQCSVFTRLGQRILRRLISKPLMVSVIEWICVFAHLVQVDHW